MLRSTVWFDFNVRLRTYVVQSMFLGCWETNKTSKWFEEVGKNDDDRGRMRECLERRRQTIVSTVICCVYKTEFAINKVLA